MKNTIRRVLGILVVMAMIFSSVITPATFSVTALAADGESFSDSGIPAADGAGEEAGDTIRYKYLAELLGLYQERLAEAESTEAAVVLAEEWQGLSEAERNLFFRLLSGEVVFAYSETNEIIGVEERKYDVDLADDVPEIPGADGNQDPEAGIPDIDIEEPVIPDIPDVPDVPDVDPADIPDVDPVDIPDTDPVDIPDTDPVDIPDTDPVDIPDTDPVDIPDTDPVDIPETDPMDVPDTDPTEIPGTDPVDNPVDNPVADGTDPVEEEPAPADDNPVVPENTDPAAEEPVTEEIPAPEKAEEPKEEQEEQPVIVETKAEETVSFEKMNGFVPAMDGTLKGMGNKDQLKGEPSDPNSNTEPVQLTLSINPTSAIYDRSSHAITVTVKAGDTDADPDKYTLQARLGDELIVSSDGKTLSLKEAGIYSVKATTTDTTIYADSEPSDFLMAIQLTVTTDPSSATYDGTEHSDVKITVTANGAAVDRNDYELSGSIEEKTDGSYLKYKDAKDYNVTAIPRAGTVYAKGEFTFTVEQADLTEMSFTTTTVAYGSASAPAMTVKAGTITNLTSEDYEVSWRESSGTEYNITLGDTTPPGTYYAKVTGKNNFKGSVENTTNTYTIQKLEVTSITADNVTYNGDAQVPVLTFKAGETDVTEGIGSNYTVAYKQGETEVQPTNVINRGTYDLTVTLTGDAANLYTIPDTVKPTFTIDPAEITGAVLNPETKEADATTDWKTKIADGTIALEVKAGTLPLLVRDTDFEITGCSAEKMIEVGDYTVTWALKNPTTSNYVIPSGFDKTTVPFKVAGQPIFAEFSEGNGSRKYTREDWFSTVTDYDKGMLIVKDQNGVRLAKGKYTVETVEMKNVGEYSLTITGVDQYAGSTPATPPVFKVTQTAVASATLTYNEAGYNREDWYTKIGVTTSSVNPYPNALTITTEAVAMTDGTTAAMILTPDEAELDTAVEMIKANVYDVAWKLKDTTNYSVTDALKKVPFTVQKAQIVSEAFSYNKVTYDRSDWNSVMEVVGDGEEQPSGEKANNLTIKAEYAIPADGIGELYLTSTEAAITAQELIDVKIDASNAVVPYEVAWTITDTTNFEIPTTSTTVKQLLDFTVVPAVVTGTGIEYSKAPYDHHDWGTELYLNGATKPSTDYPNMITMTAGPAADTWNKDSYTALDLKVADGLTMAVPELKTVTRDTDGNALPTEIPVTLTTNFQDSEGTIAPTITDVTFTVVPATIETVTIARDKGDPETKATTVYDEADWAPRISINTAEGKHHSFTVVATTAAYDLISDGAYTVNPFILNDGTDKEIDLTFSAEKLINVGEYDVQVNLDDIQNFEFSNAIGLDGTLTGDSPFVLLPFTITRYEAAPITNITESTTDPSLTKPVTYKGVYHFGPKQDASARTLKFTGEPGQPVAVTVGSETVDTHFSGEKYVNYGEEEKTTGDLTITVDASGVVMINSESKTVTLEANADVPIKLAYKNTANLKDPENTPPASVTVTAYFDTVEPDIKGAVAPFLNREETVVFAVPEPGTLDVMKFSDTVELPTEIFKEERDYSDFTVSRGVTWNNESSPSLIHSGGDAIEMQYTDLVGNTSKETFDIGQSSGAPIEIKVEPVIGDENRIDMEDRPKQVRVTITATGWELIHTSVEPSTHARQSNTMTAGGKWAQSALGEAVFTIDTDAFPNDTGITIKSQYDDLVGSTEYNFYFDEAADTMILTIPTITEDNWVIPGIAEAGSSVEVYVNGERVTNRKYDGYTVFAARQPQLEVGSTVRIIATDLSGNKSEKMLTVEPGPANGMQEMDAYAMGKVYTNAHQDKENPRWVMAGYYTEEELTAGVSVPLVAANAFHIGEVNMTLKDGKLDWSFKPVDGVQLSGQKVDAKITANKRFSISEYYGLKATEETEAEKERRENNRIGYWVVAYAKANVPVNMLHNSFQLDEAQSDIRALYFNRQRLYPLPTTKAEE